MALQISHKDITFGVGDTVRVFQKIQEAGKTRNAIFEGMVIGIKGTAGERTFTVRKIGVQKIGIEQIFPIDSPTIEKVEIKRSGTPGVRHAKLYFTRNKSRKDIEGIYSRAKKKNQPKIGKKTRTKKVTKSKKAVSKSK
jgi:large subunit ribosomal protein L19